MPTVRKITGSFRGVGDVPLTRSPIKVEHLNRNNADGVIYLKDTKTYYTDDLGKVDFRIWCNEEGQDISQYRITLPDGTYFDTVVPVGTDDLELSVLEDGGANFNDPQYTSLITYILSQVSGGTNTPLATTTVAGKVKTNSNDNDPIVYLKSEVDTLLGDKASNTAINNHVSNTSNPHNTTAAQVGAIPTASRGSANGVASLDASTLVPDTQISINIARVNQITATQAGAIATTARGTANGVASLDSSTLIPVSQIPATIARVTDITATQAGAIATSARGTANGVASLDSSTLIPDTQLSTNIARVNQITATQAGAIPATEKGAANGVATLGASSLIPNSQIASSIARVTDITAAQVGNATAQWNANLLQGRSVSTNAPSNGQVLTWNQSSNVWTPDTILGGVHPGFVSGRYYIHNKYTASINAASTGISTTTISYFPFEVEAPVTINELAVNVGTATAGSLGRIGIYSALSDTKYPGSLLMQGNAELDYGTVGQRGATFNNLFLSRGFYYIAMNCNILPTLSVGGSGYSATYSIGRSSVSTSTLLQFRENATYGVLPAVAANISSLTLSAASPPVVWFRPA